MHNTYPWLSEGELPKRLTPEVAAGLRCLARSPNSYDTDDLIEIALTKGKQSARFALEAVALERELVRAREFRKLELLLVLIAALTFLASAAQAVAAFVR
jgi:hypothetical protein